MFTGLIEEIGTLVQLQGEKLTLRCHKILEGMELGDSIAVDGVCLTVVQFDTTSFTAQVSDETFQRSSLGQRRSGSAVNLERSLKVGGKVGGHFVTGHIDGLGELRQRLIQGPFWELTFAAAPGVAKYIAAKGSIAVNGVSLTVARCEAEEFTVAVVPYSLEQTNLQYIDIGETVNLEGDILAKYVEKMLYPSTAMGIDADFLTEHGYG